MPSPSDSLRIVTLHSFEPAEIDQIKAAVQRVRIDFLVCRTREEFEEQVKDADVVYGDVRGEALKAAGRLKWVQAGGAGIEGMDRALFEGPVLITNFARTFAPAISETAFGMLLSLTRGISKYYVPQFRERQWKPVGSVKSADYAEISGRTMGIVGLGGIGCAVARRAYYGFDMRVIATDFRALHKPEYVAELRDPSWLPEMVAQADVLVAAAPHTRETERIFNEQVFRGMKKTAYFLALSRGKLFDDMALVKALQEGWIAGAGLDVFPQEPPPSSHPIFDCPNVVMTMHTSGWGPERQKRLVEQFAENVRRYAEGLPLLNVVDKKLGY
ncbi:MAG TPA: D-2-hydroxyacid dehydrogenase [Bryobacteraceae bacterium]|nr:D-2-hydroxyacid dehydrogenase [Bryobacteraceae bacterium]HZW96366.1 D-2-hydroxyacid dehydrogenase [Candidatus Eremiobacteraceae bacterium]